MFWRRKKQSGHLAKDRLRAVLLSERIDCSSHTMLMMKNEIAEAASRYLPVDEERVKLRYVASLHQIEARFPLENTQKVRKK